MNLHTVSVIGYNVFSINYEDREHHTETKFFEKIQDVFDYINKNIDSETIFSITPGVFIRFETE